MRKGLLVLGGLLLFLAIFFALDAGRSKAEAKREKLNRPRQASKSNQALRASQTTTKSGAGTSRLLALVPSEGIEPSENFPDGGTHEPEHLPKFHLPAFEAENVSLPELVQMILQSYIDVCTVTKQEPLRFSVSYPDNLGDRKDFSWKGGSLITALRMAGIIFDARLERAETQLHFESFDEKSNSTSSELLTQSFRVSPYIRDVIRGLLPKEMSNPDDSVPTLLAKIGFNQHSDAEILFDPVTANLFVHDDATQLEKLSQIIEELASTSTTKQVHVTSKVVQTNESITDLQSRVRNEGMELVMRNLAQQKGTDIMTMPSVLSRFGEEATIEIIQENGDDWTGIRQTGNVTGYGFGVSQQIHFENRPGENADGLSSQDWQTEDVGPQGFTKVHQETDANGLTSIHFSTYQVIDATGRPVDPIGMPLPDTE
ncbi:hypothetical protein [Roseibacillus persicicus]|uniref:hypothetical protein n=1 Tax=Roseibacillus persicicus TaxID=454148 RepID=UPI00167226A6|nr:hypothetical protein [Roseibacillus persicicus]